MVCSQTLQYPLQREVIAVLFLDIVTSVGRRISRAGVIITGAVLGIVAAVIVACENPQPPVSCGAIPQQTLTVGETATVSACFDDPNGDVLVYAARSSDPGVAKATGSGSSVTVTAVSPGDATVTIRADDPDGLAAEQMFAVLVPNRPPVVVGEIADRELAVGESLTLDVPGYFSEPDGQALVYAAALGADVVEGTMTGESLMIVALAKGTAPVTLTATDPGGLTATVGFSVTVPNRGPVARDTVAARTIEVGEAATVDMSPFFSDPDGDELAYTAVTSDGALATAEVSGSVIRVTAVAKGSATVTVTATDTEGAAATQSFGVTVPNRIPVAVGAIPAQTVEVGQEVSLEMGSFFTDPDGDPLAYEVATGSPAVAAAAVGDGAVTVTAVAKGSTTVTVAATDTEGSAATQSFAVTVPNRPPLAAGTIPAQTLEAGDEATLDMGSFFTDPDGDPLGYAVVVSDAVVVAASAAEGAVMLSAMAKGEATVTVTGTDLEGLTATQAFAVTVEVSPNGGKWGPGNTYTDYDFPGSGYESLAWTFLPAVDPAESLREKGLLHYYAYNFAILNHTQKVGKGYAGFQSDGHLTFGGRSRWGKVVNFAIWGSTAARTDGLLNSANEECGCHQIMVQYEWVEGRSYRFELREGPSGTEAGQKWWGLWVTDLVTGSVTFIGEQRVPTQIDGKESLLWSPRTYVFGEDMHWWRSRGGAESFVCSDFEPSSLAVLDVTAGAQQARPSQVSSRTNSGNTDIAENGYTTTLCDVTVFTAENGDVQHNVGFWPEPPKRVIGN